MKKITCTLLFLLLGLATGYSQVLVGEGTNTDQATPINTYYGYSYSQSIYLSSEINASGTITSLQWYYSGNNALANQSIVIYFGETDKSAFESETDFVPATEMTEVYAGTIATNNTPGWKTITLTTPFLYSNSLNLVIAVDENMEMYDEIDDDFYNSSVTNQRSIYAFSDTVNFDPQDPSNDQNDWVERGTSNYVPNIILGGIQQLCPNPSGVTVSGMTQTNATATWTAATGQTTWEVLFQEAALPAPAVTDSGTTVTGTATHTAGELAENTSYIAYVRAICTADEKSGWVASPSFKTLCIFSDDFVQDFDTTEYGQIPDCWTYLNLSNDPYAYVETTDYNSSSGLNCIEMFNSEDATAPLFLITPGLNSITANTHRLKFKAKTAGNYTVILGTMTDQSDATTFTALNTYSLTSEYMDYTYTFNNNTTDQFIAFKHGGGDTYFYVFLDDVVWEPIPTDLPECTIDLVATTDESCGNFPTVFNWSAIPGADGYYVSIGTAADGGDLVIDNANVYSALTYAFAGELNTTYYYSVTPYNSLGSAIGCTIETYTTYSEGCYCTSVPESFDGQGITAVQINDTEFLNEAVSYTDFSDYETLPIARGVITSVNISFATGYAYGANVWIDYNDNFTFEESELVASGISASNSTSILNTTFLTPLTANLGMHRMRIGTSSDTQSANPCFNDYGGVTIDFKIEIVPEPACLPPASTAVGMLTATTAEINWVSDAASFNVEYGPAPTMQGLGETILGVTGTTATIPNLDGQTDYNYYLQANCAGDESSPWIGPFTFRTACGAFGDFTEDFTTQQIIDKPECWSTLINSTSTEPGIKMYPFSEAIEMYNSEDASAELYLVTPALTALPSSDHRVKFKATSYHENVAIIVGTMTNPALASTFTAVQTIPLTDELLDYVVALTTSTTDTHVAFKFVGSSDYQSVTIDDFVWESNPTEAPICASNVLVETNPECGNFPTQFLWEAVPGADFYTIKIGTAPGTGEVVNVGNVTSYSFEGNIGTTYYYTVIPENTFAPATGCAEGFFTTNTQGCYCESLPNDEFMDGNGITNLEVGDASFMIPFVAYIDLTSEEAVTIVQGSTTETAITFATGFSYKTHIWVDWNDNYVFEPTEKMYTGESGTAVPFVLDASFTVPETAPLGVHRMRIGTADNGQEIPNPCYSDYYGITIDLNVTVESGLGRVDFDRNSFKVYPNPVKDVLNIMYIQNISNAAVYNMLGQEVVSKSLNASQGQIDMSALTSGTYLVKVNTDSGVQTFKVVKQ